MKELKGEAQERVFEAAKNVPKGIFLNNNSLNDQRGIGKVIVDRMFEESWLKDMDESWFPNSSAFEQQLSVAKEIFESGLLSQNDEPDAYVKLLEKCYEVYEKCNGDNRKKADIVYGARRIFETLNPINVGKLEVDDDLNWIENQKNRYIKLIDVAIKFSNHADDGYGIDGLFVEDLVKTILSINTVYHLLSKTDRYEQDMYQEFYMDKSSYIVNKAKGELLMILINKLESNGNDEMVDSILDEVSKMNGYKTDVNRNQFMKDVGILPR